MLPISLQTVPTDILYAILKRVHALQKSNKKTFKKRLGLLGVFQRLRIIALPQVYNFLYADNCLRASKKYIAYMVKYNIEFAAIIGTNADIIVSANCMHMVKTAHIFVHHTDQEFNDMHRVLFALQTCAHAWPAISNLQVSMTYHYYDLGRTNSGFKRFCTRNARYARIMADIIPGATRVEFENTEDHSVIYELYGRVIGVYAKQLLEFTINGYTELTRGRRLNQVQKLHMDMGMEKKNINLPAANVDWLTSLRIKNLPYNVSWAPFFSKKDDIMIEFPQLKHLWLQFSPEKSVNLTAKNKDSMYNVLLRFPVLSTLAVKLEHSSCPFFLMSTFPAHMKTVTVGAPRVILREIKHMDLLSADNMTMYTTRLVDDLV